MLSLVCPTFLSHHEGPASFQIVHFSSLSSRVVSLALLCPSRPACVLTKKGGLVQLPLVDPLDGGDGDGGAGVDVAPSCPHQLVPTSPHLQVLQQALQLVAPRTVRCAAWGRVFSCRRGLWDGAGHCILLTQSCSGQGHVSYGRSGCPGDGGHLVHGQ